MYSSSACQKHRQHGGPFDQKGLHAMLMPLPLLYGTVESPGLERVEVTVLGAISLFHIY